MIKYLYILCALYLAASLISQTKSEDWTKQKGDNSSLYRLPKNILPINYTILLLTNVSRGDFNYTGRVDIALLVKDPTDQIVLHSDKLRIIREKSILKRQLPDGNNENLKIDSQLYNDITQFETIIFESHLPPGKYSLILHFEGVVQDDLLGFYRSSYWTHNERRWIGVTQFSPTFARRAFPCMDEPGFKAQFQLSLGHYDNETVTSNTVVEASVATNHPGYYITTFKQTRRIPTYLLAWAIHDFSRVVSPVNPHFSLWTRHNNLSYVAKSPVLTDGPAIMLTLEDLMEISNPLGKVEQITVPDVNFQAMENWGFITYRESVPLAWPETVPAQSMISNIIVISHEYAHTWFGNLVTPEFWNVTWLKEGFATYFSYLTTSILYKNWRMMERFTVLVRQDSMLKDSYKHSRTMNGRKIGNSMSAKAAFDFVTYNKAASIIRMISEIIGEVTFLKAMRSFLKKRQYQSATQYDLYHHLKLALDENVDILSPPLPTAIGTIIDSWANQPNYPLIRVSRNRGGKFQFSQELFRLNQSIIASERPRTWWVPLKIAIYLNSSDQLIEMTCWLSNNNSCKMKLFELEGSYKWYLVNPSQIGYYRVAYELDNWQALINELNSKDFRRLPIVARAGLLDDVFNLARAGVERYTLALQLAKYLNQEDEYEPWETASRTISLLDTILRDKPEVQSNFRNYVGDLIISIYKQLSFKEGLSDPENKKVLRTLILSTACSLNIGDCISNAKSIFNNWIIDEKNTISGHLKNFVYRTGILNGTDDDWIKLWQCFLRAEFTSEKEIMMNALAYTKNPVFIIKFIEFAIQPDSNIAQQFRQQIVPLIISTSSKNIDTVISYVEKNLKKIIDLRGFQMLQKILSAIGDGITSIDQINKLQEFVDRKSNVLGIAAEAGKEAIKSARNNIAWIDNCACQISNYLNTIAAI